MVNLNFKRIIIKIIDSDYFYWHFMIKQPFLGIKNFIKYNILNHPKHLIIESSGCCNANCVWCWMMRSPKKQKGFMSFEKYKKIIDLNKDFIRKNYIVQPFNNGEMLINSEAYKILDYLAKNKIRLARLDTNLGMKINAEKLCNSKLPSIRVNIGGVTKGIHEKVMRTNFEVVIQNLKKLLKINPAKIYLKMNITKDNLCQIKYLKNFFVKLGGDPQHIYIGDVAFPIPTLANEQEKKLFFREVVSEANKNFLRFSYNLSEKDFGVKTKKRRCIYLIDYINFQGKLSLCCHDEFGLINLGDAFSTPLKELVNSKRYKEAIKKALRMQYPFCKECN